jgi:uncharacterized protein (TIGR02001 family)
MISMLSKLALGSAFAGLTAVCAQMPSPAPAPPDPTWSFTASPTLVSQYMFRGLRYGGASMQPWLGANAGGFSGGIWTSVPLSARVSGQSDPEIDPYVSYNQTLGSGVTLTPGFVAYLYPDAPLNKGAYRSTYEPSVSISVPVAGVQVTPKVSYDLVRQATTLELASAAAIPLKDIGTELDFNADVGTTRQSAAVNTSGNSLAAGKSSQDYWLAGVTLPFQVTTTAKVSVGYAYSRGFDAWIQSGALPRSPNPLAAARSIFTAALLITF